MWKFAICEETYCEEKCYFEVNIPNFNIETLKHRFLWSCISDGNNLSILDFCLNQYFSILYKFKYIKNITNFWSFNERSSILIFTYYSILRDIKFSILKEKKLYIISQTLKKFGKERFILVRIIIPFHIKNLMV